MKNSWLLLSLCWYSFLPMMAQNFVRHTEVPVYNNANTSYSLPWAGGLNNPQFSEADLNFDGIADIFVFDRGSNTPLVFLRNGTATLQESIEIEKHFPSDLHDWALLVRDACDQAIYLYTAQTDNQVRVFRLQLDNNNLPHFVLLKETLTYGAENHPITVPIYDIPAIADINSDGDIDILSFDDAGGKVQYYENQSVDNSLPCEALQFSLASDCWGNFFEPGITNELLLNDCDGSNSPLTGNNIVEQERTRHPGSALLAIDLDNDIDKDLLLGDISFNNIVAAMNNGTSESALTNSVDDHFPAYDFGVNMYIFPATYSIDADYDGLTDLLAAPNARTQSIHSQNVWFYRNNGNATQQFQFVQNDWLVGDMIDVNRNAKPAFFDYNNDGLQDLVVGNQGYNDAEDAATLHSHLALYENIGTSSAPAFRLINDNWAGVQEQFQLSRLALSPTFGDLDGDGDKDMLLGDLDGYLHYFRNQPNANGEAVMVLFQEQYAGIDAAQQNSPQLVDVDQDGLLDLLMGNHNGVVQYYHNNGSAQTPNFQMVDNTFGNVDVRALNSPTGFATPQLIVQNDSFRLYVGSESGKIFWYDDIANNLAPTATFPLVSNQILTHWKTSFSKPAFADLNNDGLSDMVVGTYQGGLLYFEQQAEAVGIAFEAPKAVLVYPNPSDSWLHIDVPFSQQATAMLSIYDLNGSLIYQQKLPTHQLNTISIADLPKGMYLLHLATAEQVYTQKWVR